MDRDELVISAILLVAVACLFVWRLRRGWSADQESRRQKAEMPTTDAELRYARRVFLATLVLLVSVVVLSILTHMQQ